MTDQPAADARRAEVLERDGRQDGAGGVAREGTPLLERSEGAPTQRTITTVLLHHQQTLLNRRL
jgi:hypothetical protein